MVESSFGWRSQDRALNPKHQGRRMVDAAAVTGLP